MTIDVIYIIQLKYLQSWQSTSNYPWGRPITDRLRYNRVIRRYIKIRTLIPTFVQQSTKALNRNSITGLLNGNPTEEKLKYNLSIFMSKCWLTRLQCNWFVSCVIVNHHACDFQQCWHLDKKLHKLVIVECCRIKQMYE